MISKRQQVKRQGPLTRPDALYSTCAVEKKEIRRCHRLSVTCMSVQYTESVGGEHAVCASRRIFMIFTLHFVFGCRCSFAVCVRACVCVCGWVGGLCAVTKINFFN